MSAQENLFLVDRIDCEDEEEKNTPLEQLVPYFIEMHHQGFAMPTLLIRCAGKKSDGVTGSLSSMKAVAILREKGGKYGKACIELLRILVLKI